MPKRKQQSDFNQNRAKERTAFILDDGGTDDSLRAAQQIKGLQNMTPEELIRFLHNFTTVYINEDQPDS